MERFLYTMALIAIVILVMVIYAAISKVIDDKGNKAYRELIEDQIRRGIRKE